MINICVYPVIWYQVFISNTNNLLIDIFPVFLSTANNFPAILVLIIFQLIYLTNKWDL